MIANLQIIDGQTRRAMAKQTAFVFQLLGYFLLIFLTGAATQARAQDEDPTNSETPAVDSSAAGPSKLTTAETTGGVFYGNLIFIHPQKFSLIVRPLGGDNKKKMFFVDRSSKFTVDGMRRDIDWIERGDKVAVRYFAEGNIAVVEELFVVFGEFIPEDYIVKKKKRKAGNAPAKPPAKH